MSKLYDQPPGFCTYDEWKRLVDEVIRGRVGVSADDLPDVDYDGLFQSGNTPNQAARFALKEADAPADLWEDLPE